MTAVPLQVPARPRLAAPAQAPTRRPQLRVVPRPARVARWCALCAAVVLAGGVGNVALNALGAGAAVQARTLEQEISDLTLRRDELIAVIGALEAPDRAFTYATGQLGMIRPEQPGYLNPAAPPPAGFEAPDKPLATPQGG